MHNLSITAHEKRNPIAYPAGPFHWSKSAETLTLQTIRTIERRARVSPVLALAIAELAGIIREVRA